MSNLWDTATGLLRAVVLVCFNIYLIQSLSKCAQPRTNAPVKEALDFLSVIRSAGALSAMAEVG